MGIRVAPVQEQGLTEARITQLDDYRQGDFSTREQLALELTELFSTAPQDTTDEFFDRLRAHFTEKEIAELGFALIAFNGYHRWNTVIDLRPQSCDSLTYIGLPNVGGDTTSK